MSFTTFEGTVWQSEKRFLSLDAVNLHTIFANRAAVMKAIPRFLRGSFRNAMRVAMDSVADE